jgi:hypothetical protein
MSQQGQIINGSTMGQMIYDITKREDVNNIFEIGTWYGLGSTKCVIDGIIDSKVNKNFISIELYKEMFEIAKINLQPYSEYVKLLFCTIVDYSEMFWFNFEDLDPIHYDKKWYYNDLERIKVSENVLDQVQEKIDLLILDGGEFSTYPEWLKLKSRSKFIFLDDTNALKCKRIREELLNDDNYKTLLDEPNDRNGFSVFEKIIN